MQRTLFPDSTLFVAILVAATLSVAGPSNAAAQLVPFENLADGPVYIVRVDGMIDKGLSMHLDRAIASAEADGASLIVLHMDTFGGLLDAADIMRKDLLSTSVPTVSFIDRNAASAGALISYATDRIVMAPGSSIGAATVVEGTGGQAAPDKYQSYMRGLMRATAEANGRDAAIAEAMVDPDLEIEGVIAAGQVLTLSTKEAVDLGVADAEIATVDALLDALGLGQAARTMHTASTSENIIRFFGSPVLQSILMLMMLGGLYFELQTPGVGFAGAMAAVGAALFFGPNYLNGLVEVWEVAVFILGVALLLAEIFVIPGFGVAGISGITLVVLSLGVSLIGNVGLSFPSGGAIASATVTLAVTMILFVGMLFGFGKYIPRSNRFAQLVLQPNLGSKEGYTSSHERSELVGVRGTAITPLRPSGAVDVNGDRIDVVTAGDWIAAGTEVEIVRVQGSRVEVRTIREVTS